MKEVYKNKFKPYFHESLIYLSIEFFVYICLAVFGFFATEAALLFVIIGVLMAVACIFENHGVSILALIDMKTNAVCVKTVRIESGVALYKRSAKGGSFSMIKSFYPKSADVDKYRLTAYCGDKKLHFISIMTFRGFWDLVTMRRCSGIDELVVTYAKRSKVILSVAAPQGLKLSKTKKNELDKMLRRINFRG